MEAPTSTRTRRHPSEPTARALIGLASAIEVTLFAMSIGGEIGDGEPGTRVFWFVLSLLLLFGIHRRSRASWTLFVAVGLVGGGLALYAAAHLSALVPLALVAVQLAALLSPQVRAHVSDAGSEKDAADPDAVDIAAHSSHRTP
jgi:hypothetical protein